MIGRDRVRSFKKRAANARVTLWTLGLTTTSAVDALFVAWKVLPTPAEIARLRTERDELAGHLGIEPVTPAV